MADTHGGRRVPSGISALDDLLDGLLLGDNVVWQVESDEEYASFARSLVERASSDGRRLLYIRFADRDPILEARPDVCVVEIDPRPGFDWFAGQLHRRIEAEGPEAFYIFDNLSTLAMYWATDELLANFFQITCPFLRELDTIAYFAITRGRHTHRALSRIRDTTQILINVYSRSGRRYVQPVKVWERYSPRMFLPHLVTAGRWNPVYDSGEAAEIASADRERVPEWVARTIAPWESIYRRLAQYQDLAGTVAVPDREVTALKREFARMMFGANPRFEALIDRHFGVNDLFAVRHRLIGSGRIGGKAVGMLLARRILSSGENEARFARRMEAHDSFFIGADVFFTFLVDNHLFRLRLRHTGSSGIDREEYREVEARFLAGSFPPEIVEQFRSMLEHFGQAPIIIRSSSLLEDDFGNAFAGKYRSEFCVNQGPLDRRLEAFLRAVKLVYASTLNPDALSYRARRGLSETDEQMAILVMRVSGRAHGTLFFPALAGVVLSRNLYVWTNRIDPSRGIVRLVFGLGTRAVNRVGDDYCRLIAVSHPELRPEIGSDVVRYSQRSFDCLDLSSNAFAARPAADVLEDSSCPGRRFLVSLAVDGELREPVGIDLLAGSSRPVLTFANLIRRTDFVATLGEMAAAVEREYEHPVEMEFAAQLHDDGGYRINVVQCRPMHIPGASTPGVPSVEPDERAVLFRADRMINGGVVRGMRFIVYVDPEAYAGSSVERKHAVGRAVGAVNRRLSELGERAILIGPGRWGSSNIDLGVRVSYADIDRTAVLVEIAREESGQVPEVSYGTHFFQDLVEDQIIYLPVYPHAGPGRFAESFFRGAPNGLLDVVPGAADVAHVVKVIHVPEAAGGATCTVVADPQTQRAVGRLEQA